MPSEVCCWCGNTEHFSPLSRSYERCLECGTLVSTQALSPDALQVKDQEHDFYGKEYWPSHQENELGLPSIYERTRQDFPDRSHEHNKNGIPLTK